MLMVGKGSASCAGEGGQPCVTLGSQCPQGPPQPPKAGGWGSAEPSLTHPPMSPTPRKGHQALGTRTQVYFFLAVAAHSHHPQAQSTPPPPVQGGNWDQWTVGTGTGGDALPPPRSARGHVQLHQPPLQTCPLQGHGQETPRGCSDVPKGQQSSCRGTARTRVLLGKGQGGGHRRPTPQKTSDMTAKAPGDTLKKIIVKITA